MPTPPAEEEESGESGEEPVYKHDKYFGGGYWYRNGTFVSTKAVKKAARAGAAAGTAATTACAATKVKVGATIAAKAGRSKAGASNSSATKAGTAHGGTAGSGARAAGKAAGKAASKAAMSGPRCSGKCRLARPCPTAQNRDGRGACGNDGCDNHGALYGCKPCGIRLCSMECINAHMFEGRSMKVRLQQVAFHDWYQGE